MNSFQAQWHSNLFDRTLSKLDLLQFPNTKTFIQLWPRGKKYHAITNLRWNLLGKEDNESILLLCQLRRHSSRLVPQSLRTSMLTFWTHIGRWGARGSNQLSTRVGCPWGFGEDGDSRSPRELLRVQLYISRSNGSHNWAASWRFFWTLSLFLKSSSKTWFFPHHPRLGNSMLYPSSPHPRLINFIFSYTMTPAALTISQLHWTLSEFHLSEPQASTNLLNNIPSLDQSEPSKEHLTTWLNHIHLFILTVAFEGQCSISTVVWKFSRIGPG